jgi:uncharacterized membrane protein YuzA (DUF378 family)
MNTYIDAKIHMVFMAIIMIGCINWGFVAFDYNPVEMLSNNMKTSFKTEIPFDKIIYILVAICAIIILFRRSTWLPFLGKTVFPGSLFTIKKPIGANRIITIQTKPNTKIAYWASLPKGANPDVVTAYADFSNSGVVMSDANGHAELHVIEGSGYTVPSGRKIDRHIHYRLLDLEYGMASKVKTVYY